MADIPAAAKKPQDHKSPAQKEAEGIETAQFEWRGETFTVPASPDDWPWEVTEAFDDGKMSYAIKALLGDDYVKFSAMKPRNKDASDFFEKMGEALGFESGG